MNLKTPKVWITALWDWALVIFAAPLHAMQIHWLQFEVQRAYRIHKPNIDAARAVGDEEGADKYIDDYLQDKFEVDEEIATKNSSHLQSEAQRLGIPVPEFSKTSGDWEQSILNGRWRFTPEAMARLRTAVRTERKERREALKFWVGALVGTLSVATGFVGALIGLLAYRAT